MAFVLLASFSFTMAIEVPFIVYGDWLETTFGLSLSTLGLAASLLALPWLAGLGLGAALAGVMLMMLSFEFGLVSLLPLASELTPEARAPLLLLLYMAFSLSRILGAFLGGWLWRWQSITLQAGAGVGCALLAAVVLARGMKELG